MAQAPGQGRDPYRATHARLSSPESPVCGSTEKQRADHGGWAGLMGNGLERQPLLAHLKFPIVEARSGTDQTEYTECDPRPGSAGTGRSKWPLPFPSFPTLLQLPGEATSLEWDSRWHPPQYLVNPHLLAAFWVPERLCFSDRQMAKVLVTVAAKGVRVDLKWTAQTPGCV